EVRGADHAGLVTHLGRAYLGDRQQAALGQRTVVRQAGGPQQEVAGLDDAAADDQDGRVEHLDQVGEAGTQPAADLLERLDRHRVAAQRRPGHQRPVDRLDVATGEGEQLGRLVGPVAGRRPGEPDASIHPAAPIPTASTGYAAASSWITSTIIRWTCETSSAGVSRRALARTLPSASTTPPATLVPPTSTPIVSDTGSLPLLFRPRDQPWSVFSSAARAALRGARTDAPFVPADRPAALFPPVPALAAVAFFATPAFVTPSSAT